MRPWSWWDVAYTAVRRGPTFLGWSHDAGMSPPMARVAARRERRADQRYRNFVAALGGGSGSRGQLMFRIGLALVAAALAILLLSSGSDVSESGTRRDPVQGLLGLLGLVSGLYFILRGIRGRRAFGPADHPRVRQARWLRTLFYDRAVRSADPLRCAVVAQRHAHRVETWRERLTTGRNLTSRGSFCFADPWSGPTVLLLFIAMPLSAALQNALSAWHAPRLSCFVSVVLLLAVAMIPVRLSLVRRRLLRALEERSCPNCRYDLSTLPAAIDPTLVGGCSIGPARCPECGSPWPLVPPPADEELSRAPVASATREDPAPRPDTLRGE